MNKASHSDATLGARVAADPRYVALVRDRQRFSWCCRSNANRSLHDACRTFGCGPYPMTDRHSAWAAERRSL